jgi:hypothetical protein
MICALFSAGLATAQSKDRKPAEGPTAFYEDCGGDCPCLFDHPVPLPDNVLDAILATKEAKSMQDQLRRLNREQIAGLFRAIEIHLGDRKELDYVVLSVQPLGGADAPWFWIVRFNQTHPKVIFYTFANGFEKLKSWSNGYPNLRSKAWAGSIQYTSIYHYNGRRYILVHKYQKENAPQP